MASGGEERKKKIVIFNSLYLSYFSYIQTKYKIIFIYFCLSIFLEYLDGFYYQSSIFSSSLFLLPYNLIFLFYTHFSSFLSFFFSFYFICFHSPFFNLTPLRCLYPKKKPIRRSNNAGLVIFNTFYTVILQVLASKSPRYIPLLAF